MHGSPSEAARFTRSPGPCTKRKYRSEECFALLRHHPLPTATSCGSQPASKAAMQHPSPKLLTLFGGKSVAFFTFLCVPLYVLLRSGQLHECSQKTLQCSCAVLSSYAFLYVPVTFLYVFSMILRRQCSKDMRSYAFRENRLANLAKCF